MSLPALRKLALFVLVPLGLAAASAGAAMVTVDGLVLHADGSFQPQTLPRHRYAPVEFQGYVDLAEKGGGKPTPLRQAIVDFDRDGRLSVAGLPTCAPETIAAASTPEARRICRGSIVGSGKVEALVALPGETVLASSPLTIFNGPPLPSGPSVVLHARTTVPATQTYAILAPIERRAGRYRYRVTLDLPPLAAGYGAITRLEVKVGRRYRAGGRQRSYVSARCGDNVLETHGRFSFEDGTIIDGSVEKYCHAS
jgi:hypothetical protein